MLFFLTRAVCFPGDLTLTICSCIMHQLISWWIIDSDWSEREECRRQSPYAFLVLKSKMSSSITQKNSVQILDSDWSTWPRTNEPHLKKQGLSKGLLTIVFSQESRLLNQTLKSWIFPNASHLLRRTCKAQVLGSGEKGLTDSKLAAMRVVSEEMFVGNAFFDKDDNQSCPCSLRKYIF